MTGKAFSKAMRLLKSSEFSRVFAVRSKEKFTTKESFFRLLALPNGSQQHRVGLVVAKKQLKLAVDRNRFKRLIREVFRGDWQKSCQPDDLIKGLDFVVIVELSGLNKKPAASLNTFNSKAVKIKAAKQVFTKQDFADYSLALKAALEKACRYYQKS